MNITAAIIFIVSLFPHTHGQVFKPRALYAHLPVVDGQRLLFREHSFLDNRRTPGGFGLGGGGVRAGAV